MEFLKKYSPILIMWSAIICYVIIDKTNDRFAALEKEVCKIKTVMLLQNIMPVELACEVIE